MAQLERRLISHDIHILQPSFRHTHILRTSDVLKNHQTHLSRAPEGAPPPPPPNPRPTNAQWGLGRPESLQDPWPVVGCVCVLSYAWSTSHITTTVCGSEIRRPKHPTIWNLSFGSRCLLGGTRPQPLMLAKGNQKETNQVKACPKEATHLDAEM